MRVCSSCANKTKTIAMPLTPDALQAIHALLAPVIGREAWGVHLGYGAGLTIHFGADKSETRTTRSGRQWVRTRGEWDIWTVSCVWRLEDATGILAAYEDPRPLQDQALTRLNGRRLLSIDISPTSADTVFTFNDEVVVRLFSIYMDPQGDQEHWMLFGPAHYVLVLGPGTQWASKRSDVSTDPLAVSDQAIHRFETLLNDAWPCVIETFAIHRTQRGTRDHLDLHLRLRPSNPDDPRRITLQFAGVQYLDFSQVDAETGIDHLQIEAVGHRGWNEITYAVYNPGQHILTFYCASFEAALA